MAQPVRLLLSYTGTEFENKLYPVGPAPDYAKSEWLADKEVLGLEIPNVSILYRFLILLNTIFVYKFLLQTKIKVVKSFIIACITTKYKIFIKYINFNYLNTFSYHIISTKMYA